jgi:hypothetical protein
LAALFPYVKDVNVKAPFDETAGHNVAGAADLDTFMRLEGEGLDKTAIERSVLPTYAHRVAVCKDQEKAEPFIKHLGENGYPLNDRAKQLPDHPGEPHTPIESAADAGHFYSVLSFVDADVPITPEVLKIAIQQTIIHDRDPRNIVYLIDGLAERNALNTQIFLSVAEKLNDYDSVRKESARDIVLEKLLPIAQTLIKHAETAGCAYKMPVLLGKHLTSQGPTQEVNLLGFE